MAAGSACLSPTARNAATPALVFALAFGSGCRPKIGDDCSSALDCSSLGDRLCDVTQPAGYCTLFNCQPDSCPQEAACVVFRSELDPACGSSKDGEFARFSQSFCMMVCADSSDCRDGYTCARPVERDARLLDQNRESPDELQVCVAVATVPQAPSAAPGVCSPGKPDPLVPYQPSSTQASTSSQASSSSAASAMSAGSTATVGGAGGAGGQAGQGGAAGSGGR